MKIEDIISNVKVYGLDESIAASKLPMAVKAEEVTSEITERTKKLGQAKSGSGHDNFLKGIIVQFDLKATVKLWTEMERYHFVEFVSSQSSMHRIAQFNLDEQYISYVDPRMVTIMKELVEEYNTYKKQGETEKAKIAYLNCLYSSPAGLQLTARLSTNYQQLKTIYYQRRNHRLPEWRTICQWIESLPRFKELVLGEEEIAA